MKIIKLSFLILILSNLWISAFADEEKRFDTPCLVSSPFNRGVNLSLWFEKKDPRSVQFTFFTKETFLNLKEMGVDVVRLPIHFENLSSGTPKYIVDETVLSYLDEIVSWAEELEIYLIIDNHSFDSSKDTPSDIEKRLKCVWSQIAKRYKNSSKYILYEILNEPHGIDKVKWGKIQGNIIQLIRRKDPKHTIVVGGADWNSYKTLKDLPEYKDDNLLYTYHFYEPMIFTHQGAGWTDCKNFKKIPFPCNIKEISEIPSEYYEYSERKKIEKYLKVYSKENAKNSLQKPMREVSEFSNKRNVPVFCGEFGVMMTYAENKDRVAWYKNVRTVLEEENIAWIMWDYRGSFGLFKTSQSSIYPDEINRDIAEVLKLIPCNDNKIKINEYPLMLVKDGLVCSDVSVCDSFNNGHVYCNQKLKDNTACVEWGNCKRYGSLSFIFNSFVDLSKIKEDGFIEFKIRSDFKGRRLQLRFENNDSEEELPWRNSVTLTNNENDNLSNNRIYVPADGNFHVVRIPLSSFVETGAWQNSTKQWYEQKGLFSWMKVRSIEFVAEYSDFEKSIVQIKDLKVSKN